MNIILTPFFTSISSTFTLHSLLNRGVRIALRSKVNDSMVTGIRILDCTLPVGRGQRQLILGDRFTGKTNIFLTSLLHANITNVLGSVDGRLD